MPASALRLEALSAAHRHRSFGRLLDDGSEDTKKLLVEILKLHLLMAFAGDCAAKKVLPTECLGACALALQMLSHPPLSRLPAKDALQEEVVGRTRTYGKIFWPPLRPGGQQGRSESNSAVELFEHNAVAFPSAASWPEVEIKKQSRSKKLGFTKREIAGPLFKLRDERIAHFSGRTTWAEAVAADPMLKPLTHIEHVYPDRRRGLLRPDLRKIDPSLAQALTNWLKYKRADGSKPNSIPSDFGLMTAAEWYELLDREEGTPTGAEVFEAYRRGDPNAGELGRRQSAAHRRQGKGPNRPRGSKSRKARKHHNL